MTTIVDARGKPCPQPVIMTRKAILSGLPVTTIVDNDTSRHNVTHMVEKAGYNVSTEHLEDGIYIHIDQEHGDAVNLQQPDAAIAAGSTPAGGPLVVTIPGDTMGHGDAELGSILMRGFFHTLGETDPLPDAIIFFNSGVKLVVEGSPVADDLKALSDLDVEILACGTCLDFFDIKDKLVVGEVSNMYTIVETLLNAGRVLSI